MMHALNDSLRLSKEEVSCFLNYHNLGKLQNIRLLSKGVDTTTFSLKTPTNIYILTLFHENLDLPFMQKATHFFTSRGFPFTTLLAIGTIKEKPATITPLLTGKNKPEWSTKEYETLGFTLGNIHKCAETYPNPPQTLPFIWQLSQNFFDIQQKIPKEFQILEQEIFFLEEHWPYHLPKGLIHGDLWHTNILFQNDSISGILDFHPSYEPFILDLANIIKGIFEEECREALLSTYEITRPLSSIEHTYLPLLTQAKIIATILYLLKKSALYPHLKNKFLSHAFLNLLKIREIEV